MCEKFLHFVRKATLDEKIVAFERNNEKRIQNSEVFTDVFPGISIWIPKNFELLTEEEAKQRYTSDYRPEVIYSKKNQRIDFSFNLLRKRDFDLTLYLSEIINSIKLIYPNLLIYHEESLQCSNEACLVRYFDFRMSSFDGPIYNIIYLSTNGQKSLMGAFNCPFEDYMAWRDTALEVIKTIQITE